MVPPVSQAPRSTQLRIPPSEKVQIAQGPSSPISLTEQMQGAEGGAAGLITGLRRQRLGVVSMAGCCLWGL